MSYVVRIGSRIGTADPFWVQVRAAVEQRAHQIGAQLLDLDLDLATAHTPVGREAALDALLAHNLHALIVAYCPETLAYEALDAGLPMIHLTETGVRHPRMTSPRGFYDIARMIGAFLIERLNGQGRVLVVGGMVAGRGEDGRSRIAGIFDALRNFPAIQIEYVPSAWRYEHAFPQLEAAMRRLERPPDAVFGLSDSLALAARDVGRALGVLAPETLIVGINGDPLALAAIAEGSMTATVETAAADMGARAVELALAAAQGEALPAYFDLRPRLVTAENVAEVAMQKLIAIADLPSRLVGVNALRDRQRVAHLETSLAINRRIGAILDRHQLVQEIAERIEAAFGFSQVRLYRLIPQTNELALDFPPDVAPEAQSLPLDESGPLRQALVHGEALVIPDTRTSLRRDAGVAWPEIRSRAILPVRLGSAVYGLLDLGEDQPRLLSSAEVAALQLLADQLGIALHNAELYGDAVGARAAAERAGALKTRLLARVGEELRAPLAVIAESVEAALAATPEGEVRIRLERIRRSAGYLMNLNDTLIDLARGDAGALNLHLEPVDTRSFLADVFQHAAETVAAPRHVVWRLDVPDRLPPIEADRRRLRQVLLHLLDNAGKFTRRGHIVLGARCDEDEFHLWVEDSGPGIAADVHARMFEPFITGEPGGLRREGIGLGLSITRLLVELHGGRMTVESEVGRGSVFHVHLPRAPGARGEAPPVTNGRARPLPAARESSLMPRTGALARRALAFIQQHHTRDLSRREIAEAIGVSCSYLGQLFQRELGVSPWEYLHRYRIERACELLRMSDASVTAIAEQVGFNDPAYFSRVFRRQAGCSPREYRRAARGVGDANQTPRQTTLPGRIA